MKLTSSALETFQFGVEVGRQLPKNSAVCLFGELAAGKTTLIKGLVHGITGLDPNLVSSPTFIYLNIYEGAGSKYKVYHFDLYRLHYPEEFFSMGFEEFFCAGGICCIEWSERIGEMLPEERLSLFLSHEGDDRRQIVMDTQRAPFPIFIA